MKKKSHQTPRKSLKQISIDLVQAAKTRVAATVELPNNFDEIFDRIIDNDLPNLAGLLHSALMTDLPAQVKWRNRKDAGFRSRNTKRWRRALDLLEAEWAVAQEVGGGFFTDEKTSALAEEDYLFEALTNLQGRALLVAREVICLIEGGFPDGAMSRWRTLHEYNVTAHFLLKHGKHAARLYVASAQFHALKRAKHAQEFSAADPSAFIPPEIIAILEQQCAETTAAIGSDLHDDYAWAALVLGRKRATFFEIERDTGRDFWRPRVRWASQHIHGNHVGSRALLGMAEADNQIAMLVGPSNGGMVDPLQMVARSLADVTEALLSSKPDLMRKIAINLLWKFANDVGDTAMDCQERFRRKHGLGSDD